MLSIPLLAWSFHALSLMFYLSLWKLQILAAFYRIHKRELSSISLHIKRRKQREIKKRDLFVRQTQLFLARSKLENNK